MKDPFSPAGRYAYACPRCPGLVSLLPGRSTCKCRAAGRSLPGYPRTVRRKPRRSLWPLRLALVAAAVALLAIEGALRDSPGAGAAIALSFLLGAAIGGARHG